MKRRLEDVARRMLARRGFVVGRRLTENRLDHSLVRVLSEYRVDCVIDVGANTGQYANMLRHVCGWPGPIRSFEPVGENFAELSRVMKDDIDWRGFCLALGSTPRTAVMRHFPAGSGLDSLLAPTEYGRSRFGMADAREETVTIARLDAMLDDVVAPAAGERLLLKIDAQGVDIDVLRGASGSLSRIVALQLELAARPSYHGVPTLGNALDEVMDLGFDPVVLDPVARDHDRMRVIEFDGLFVRAR